jgi:cbb3-type cytochrome c oxidase subunit II
MNRLERFSTVFLIAGFISFLVAFLFLGIWPATMTSKTDLSADMPRKVPAEFQVHYKSVEAYQDGLRRGRDLYVREACWHCHSQYVRPVSGESLMYGNVSTPGEYENELNRPQLFGTRRVGPDLTREAGKRTNDWHFVHLYNPKAVEPASIMPGYTWYFDESTNPPTPTADAVALVAYLQNLGAWVKDVRRSQWDMNAVVLPPTTEE